MASPAQVAANKENAKHARTLSEETKQSLRTRAIKHGLTATLDTNTVVKGENKQEFEIIRNALLSDATLGTAQEILLINLQAESYWKLQRAGKMESGAFSISLIAEQMKNTVAQNLKEEDLAPALAFALREQFKWFDNLRRYSTAAERAFYRATRELAMIRKAGPQEPIGYDLQESVSRESVSQESVLQESVSQATVPAPANNPAPEIGYDSQSPESHESNDEPPETSDPRPEIGYVSQTAETQYAPQSGTATPVASSGKFDNMSTEEALAFIDQPTLFNPIFGRRK
jgi:hypothetical protein